MSPVRRWWWHRPGRRLRGRGVSRPSATARLAAHREQGIRVAERVLYRPIISRGPGHRSIFPYRFDPSRMKSVSMPTLLLIGEDTASPYARTVDRGLAELAADADPRSA